MKASNPRNHTGIAVALVVVALVIGAGLFASTYLRARTVTETITTRQSTTLTETSVTTTTATATPAATSTVEGVLRYGAITFLSPWQYVGNVTLSGPLSACEAVHSSCQNNPTSQAEQFANGTSNIDAEEQTGCSGGGLIVACTTWTVLVSNDAIYCITPTVTWAPQCP